MAINTEQASNTIKSKDQLQKSGRVNSTWKEVDKALNNIKETFGFVPTFINNIVDQSLPGAWQEAKNLRFSADTALDIKTKGLIGVAVASQIPCEMVAYFDQKSTLAENTTPQEQYEAVMMAAMTRHWSTVLNGLQLDKNEFKSEADQIMAYVKNMMKEAGDNLPTEEMFLVNPKSSVDEIYKDIKNTLGLVPKFFKLFPKEGIAGAWSEFKGLQLNPFTQLSGKQKELIGLAVAAQIPCDYCIYFHRSAAYLNGSNDLEIQEAIGLAALARHWSTVFHGPQIDFATFKKDADKMIQNSSKYRLQS